MLPESVLEQNKVMRLPVFFRTKKSKGSQYKSLYLEDDDETDDYQLLHQHLKIECWNLENPTPDDIVHSAAKYWLKNEKQMGISADRSQFLDTMQCFASDFGKKKFPYWLTDESFKRFFEHENCVPARRNSLVKNGILRLDADKFIRWLCDVFIGDVFGEVPDRVLGNKPEFTMELDKELLMFVCEQNGLYMTRDFIDWNARKCTKLSQIHPEYLAKRFENEFEDEPSKYSEVLKNEGDLVKKQASINIIRDKCSYVIDLFEMPLDDVLEEIRNNLKTTHPRDQLLWVRVSPKYAWDVNPVLFRHIIRNYICSGNKLKLADFVALCYEDDEFSKDVCYRPGAFSQKIERVAKSIMNRSVISLEDSSVEKFVQTSLKKVVPYLSGKTKGVKNWDCVDLLLFGIMKSEMQDKKVGFKDYDTFLERNGMKKSSAPKFLSTKEITDLLDIGQPYFEANAQQDAEEIQKLCPNQFMTEATGYSKSFCFRKFTRTEWIKIVGEIVRLGFYRDDLVKNMDLEIWSQVMEASKVLHHRKLEAIQKEFITEIDAHIANYVVDEEIKDAFIEVWNSSKFRSVDT